MQVQGTLKKNESTLEQNVNYSLLVGDNEIVLNSLIGKTITLTHTGKIICSSCGKTTKKELLTRPLLPMYEKAR